VTPARKRDLIDALQRRGHVVAMTGDGVNDVPALKQADLGIAMGSGSPATRAVGRVVLLDNEFSRLPGVVAEGRRVIANIERVANLFLTKTVYATLLALSVGVASLPYPFYPRHLTVVSSLTIGIPAFFLALAPNTTRARPGFVGRVLRFAIPAGAVTAAATFTGYALARSQADVDLRQARTTATIVLFVVALHVLMILVRSPARWQKALVAVMAAAFAAVLAVPPLRRLFDFDLPPAIVLLAGTGAAALAWACLELGWRVAGWVEHRSAHRGASGTGEEP
jgi:cation-transporting ATPase E